MTTAYMDNGSTQQRLKLSPADVVVLYQLSLGDRLPGGDNLLSDLQVSAAQVEQARQGLLRRKVLLRTPDLLDVMLAPAAGLTFSTVLYPVTLGIVQLTGKNRPARQLCLSWSAEQAVLNEVDASGNHNLERLASPEAVAAAIMRECGLDAAASGASQPASSATAAPTDPEAVYQKADLRALLLIVANPSRPGEAADALSWLLSDGQLWLLARRGQVGAAMALITPADLLQLLVGLAEQCAESATLPV